MIGRNDYWNSRGVNIKSCVNLCRELGWKECYGDKLMAAFEILKTQYQVNHL